MRCRLPIGLAALALAACYEPTYPKGLACSSAHTCPPGQYCLLPDDVCHDLGSGADAPAATDAAADAAGRTPDAGGGTDGVPDAAPAACPAPAGAPGPAATEAPR